MPRTARTLVLLLVIGSLSVGAGCGSKKGTPEKKDGKSAGKAPANKAGKSGDAGSAQDDPLKVLQAFVAAIRAKDKQKCLALVHADNRKELEGDMQRGFPPVPDSPNLQVTPAADGQTAAFSGVPALKNLKLRKDAGKWWIAD